MDQNTTGAEINLKPSEVADIMNVMAACFKKLGFTPYESPVSHRPGTAGVYLMAHGRDPAKGMTDDDMWLRIQTWVSPTGKQAVSLDFKAGPNFWLEVTALVPKQEYQEWTPGMIETSRDRPGPDN